MKTKWRTNLPEGDACLAGANLLTIDGGGMGEDGSNEKKRQVLFLTGTFPHCTPIQILQHPKLLHDSIR